MSKVADILVGKVLEQLNNGIAPWIKPWATSEPRNAVSNKVYSGINYLLLEHGNFMTFKQAKSLGAFVKKGAKGHQVAWYGDYTPKDEEKVIKILKFYYVFRVEDIEGLPEKYYNNVKQIDFVPEEKAEQIIARLAPVVTGNEQRAYFRPSANLINMPKPESFKSVADYYYTFFHELIHWTKQNGMDRNLDYATEELVAEIGAAIVMNRLGFPPNEQNAAYCAHWAERIKDREVNLFKASSLAQKAAEFIIG